MFQVWDEESANLVGSYATEDAALAIIRAAIDLHGREVVDALLLLREDASGDLTQVAVGARLVELALARTSPAA
jgi:hypothetical protein